MNTRLIKILLVDFITLICLAYAVQNLVNMDMAYMSFAYVMGNTDHTVYSSSFMPAITSPILIWLALVIVVGSEFLAGALAAIGVFSMWSNRNASADDFNASKKYALWGCGLGILIWMGFFGGFGGAVFQMWQTEIGKNSLNGAFQYFMSCAVVYIIISMKDE